MREKRIGEVRVNVRYKRWRRRRKKEKKKKERRKREKNEGLEYKQKTANEIE